MRHEVTQQVADTAIQAVISKAPYVGVTMTIVYGYSLNEWLAMFGIVFTVLTFVLNWYMQRQRIKLMRETARNERGSRKQSDDSHPEE